MRRALVFLIVFGLGLALLWKLSGGFQLGTQPAPATEPAEVSGEFTEIPLPPKPPSAEPTQPGAEPTAEQPQVIRVVPDGPLALTVRKGTGGVERPEIELRAQDVDSVGGDQYDLNDLEVEVLDPATGTKRARIESPRAHTTIVLDRAGSGGSQLKSARFTDVTLTLLEGAPIVPLRFRAPSLDWDVEAFGFTSAERVRADGEGFASEGTGLRAGYGESRLVLEQDATARLSLAGGVEAALSSGKAGALVVERIDREGVAWVDVTAAEGARLDVRGADPFTIDARTIHLVGRMPVGAGETYELVSADARGDVVATSRGDEFRAQRAEFGFAPGGRIQRADLHEGVVLRSGQDSFRADSAAFEFGPLGELVRATLVGAPEGDVGLGRHLATQRPDRTLGRARIRGAGPLVIELAQGVEIDLVGPARVDVPELEIALTATTRLRAEVAEDRQAGVLAAGGAAVVDAGCERLESDALELRWTVGADSRPVVALVSPGVTQVRGTTRAGQALELDALEGLSARWSAERLFVPEARSVSLLVSGSDGLRARARRVQELDWTARTFRADGDVEFSGLDGQGVAERAIVRGERDIELFGIHGRRAAYALHRSQDAARSALRAEARALEIRATERRVQARGEAQVEAEIGAQRLDLAADTIELTGRNG